MYKCKMTFVRIDSFLSKINILSMEWRGDKNQGFARRYAIFSSVSKGGRDEREREIRESRVKK